MFFGLLLTCCIGDKRTMTWTFKFLKIDRTTLLFLYSTGRHFNLSKSTIRNQDTCPYTHTPVVNAQYQLMLNTTNFSVIYLVELIALKSNFMSVLFLFPSVSSPRNRIHIDLQTHDGLMLRRLENMRGSAFAVSGTRKVACVVSLLSIFSPNLYS